MLKDANIDHGRPYNWGRASADYAKYRDIYPTSFFEKLRGFGFGLPGQHILDIGTGSGVLPRAMLAQESNDLRFTGVDITSEQIAMARELSQGLPVEYHVGPAEEIDFPPETFDAATACQCFWYFDRSALLPKLHQVLKPGGRFGILSMAWLPQESKIARQSEALVLKYNPAWTGGGLAALPALPELPWAEPLFRVQPGALYCEDLPFTRESWHGRMLACRGIGASLLPPEKIAVFEEEHRQFLETLPEKFTIPHQMVMIILQKNLI